MKETIILVIILILILIYIVYNMEEFTPFNILINYSDYQKINNLFKKILNIIDNNKITYWIQGGTLLGAVRNNGIIPWDDDIDISVINTDEKKLILLKKEFLKNGLDIIPYSFGYKIYDVNGSIIKPEYKFKFPFVDVFIVKNTNDIFKYTSYHAFNIWKNDYFTKEELYPLKLYQFENYKVYGPQNPFPYLDRLYPNWRNKAIKEYDHIKDNKIKKIEFDVVYNNTNKPYLWQYWEGDMPDYISLCMETVDKHCSNDFNIIRLNKQNIYKYLPQIKEYEDKINKLIIPHQVDIYRIMLLYKYGGIYMDADVIVLRNPIEIMNHLKEFDFVGFGCTGEICQYGYGNPSNWLLISRQNTQLMANILKTLLNKLNTQDKFDYHDLGKMVIWKELDNLIKTQKYKYFHYPNKIDGSRDKDGKWVTSDRIFSNEKINYEDESNMLFLIIYNSEIHNDIKKISKDEILNKDWNYSKFIKKSLY
jgi:phosphorylcholine metabolism protein LicD